LSIADLCIWGFVYLSARQTNGQIPEQSNRF
jgi:hypothetical protein